MARLSDIETKIEKIKNKGSVHYEPIGLTGRITSYLHLKLNKSIILNFRTGYGLNEVDHKLVWDEHDIDIKIGLFSSINKTELKPNETYKPLIEKAITNIKPLQMSENTQDNFTGMRKHLFEAMRKIEGGTMKAEDAKAMAQIAQTIINSAKAEMEFKLLIDKAPKTNLID